MARDQGYVHFVGQHGEPLLPDHPANDSAYALYASHPITVVGVDGPVEAGDESVDTESGTNGKVRTLWIRGLRSDLCDPTVSGCTSRLEHWRSLPW